MKKLGDLGNQKSMEAEGTQPNFPGTKSYQKPHDLYNKAPKEMTKGAETSQPSSFSGAFPSSSDLFSRTANKPVPTSASHSDASAMLPMSKKITAIHQPASPQPISFNIKNSIRTFTGREGVIQKLHETLQQKDTKPGVPSQIVLLTGMGGIGKTETVRKYIELYSEKHYYHTIWIDAKDYTTTMTCFHTLGRAIESIDEGMDLADLIVDQNVEKYIYNFICTKPCLIIFDNVSEIRNAFISLLLPKILQQGLTLPTVIVTSRSRNLYNLPTIQLEGFTQEECYSLLKQELNFREDETFSDNVEYIANMSEGHPLILQQVISLVGEQKTIPGRSLSTFDSDLRSVSNQFYRDTKSLKILPADSSNGQSLFTTFTNILYALESWFVKTQYDSIINCLNTIALLSPGKIPTLLLERLREESAETSGTVADSLKMLHELNLITVGDSFCKMHRAVQTIVLIASPTGLTPKLVETVTVKFCKFLESMPAAAEYATAVLSIGASFFVKAEIEFLEEYRIKFLGILNSKLEEAGLDALSNFNSRPIVRRLNDRQTKTVGSSMNYHVIQKTMLYFIYKGIQINEHVPPEVEFESNELDSVSVIKASEPSLNISIDTQDGDSPRSFISDPQDDTFSGKRGRDLEELLTRHLSELRDYGDSFPFHTLIWNLLQKICAKMMYPDNVADELMTSSVLTKFQFKNIKRQRLDWNKTEIIFGVVLKYEAISPLISALVTTGNLAVLELIEKHAKQFDPKDPISVVAISDAEITYSTNDG
ncbi:unnamed protein product [Allacma fusca]|uniref:NB-ARC domain-containing protein n=1 Tax=Allacma fusca TaxID=39272 RepID=A0A8J2K324_9HEXA|nr:unnamed protein product [Allacma fusca]